MRKTFRKILAVISAIAVLTAAVSSALTFTAAAAGTLLDFQFTEGSLTDTSGNYTLVSDKASQADGLITAGDAVYRAGVANTSFSEPAKDMYLDTAQNNPFSSLGSEVTFNTWFKPSGTAGDSVLFCVADDYDTGAGATTGWLMVKYRDNNLEVEYLAHNDNKVKNVSATGNGAALPGYNGDVGAYHMITVTVSDNTSSNVCIYLDGELISSYTHETSLISNLKAANYLSLGSSLGWNNSMCPGTFDSFTVFDAALTANEVKAEYRNSYPADALNVIDLIEAVPAAGDAGYDAAVSAADSAFEALSDNLKSVIPNAAKLAAAKRTADPDALLQFEFVDGSLTDVTGIYTLTSTANTAGKVSGRNYMNDAVGYFGKNNNSWTNPTKHLYLDTKDNNPFADIGEDITISFWYKMNKYADGLLCFADEPAEDGNSVTGYMMIKANAADFVSVESKEHNASKAATPLSSQSGFIQNEYCMMTITQSKESDGTLNTKIYMNGLPVASGTAQASFQNVLQNLSYLSLGTSLGWNNGSCNGAYDSFKVLNKCQTAEEVLSDFTGKTDLPKAVTVNTEKPVFNLPFGDAYQNYALPASVEVTLDDGKTASANAFWDTSSVNNTASGKYIVNATLTSPDQSFTVPDELKFTAEFNIAEKPENVVYISDLDYTDSQFAWQSLYRDHGQEGDKLALNIDGKFTYFAKAAGANAGIAPVYATFNIPENAVKFEAYLGNTHSRGTYSTNVYFGILLDGVDVTPDDLAGKGFINESDAYHLVLDVTGKSTITLQYKTAEQFNGGADGTYADAKFVINAPADYSAVEAAKAAAAELTEADYTAESWAKLTAALAAVVEDLTDDKQAEVDKMAADINVAIDALVLKALEMDIDISEGIAVQNGAKFDITWNADVIIGKDTSIGEINKLAKFTDYGVYYGTSSEEVDKLAAGTDTEKAAQMSFKSTVDENDSVNVYTIFGFRLKGVNEGRTRAAKFYITYEYNGNTYTVLSDTIAAETGAIAAE